MPKEILNVCTIEVLTCFQCLLAALGMAYHAFQVGLEPGINVLRTLWPNGLLHQQRMHKAS